MFEEKKSLTREEKRIRKKASEWLVEKDEGWEEGRDTAFQQWLDEDIRHAIAVRELELSWSRLQQLQEVLVDPTLLPNTELLKSSGRARPRSRRTFIAAFSSLAAVFALSMGIWLFWDSITGGKQTGPTIYTTTFNDFKEIALQDGSILELNSNSKVSIDFSKARRQVQLVRGEAHFQVAKDPSKPFFVGVGSVIVRAVGTAFNIRYSREEIQVLVTEGTVALNTFMDSPEEADPENLVEEVPKLGAGDQATISTTAPRAKPFVKTVKDEEYASILAWKGPRLFFDSTPLNVAARQFNAQNALQIVVEDPVLRNLAIGGSFLVEDVEAFLRLLADEGSVRVERTSQDRVILKPVHQLLPE